MARLPDELHWLFFEVDPRTIDVEADADFVIPRILELGRLRDVYWTIDTYGLERIHSFFRDVGHPTLSKKTLSFWRCILHAKNEPWADRTTSRARSGAPWID